MSARKDRSHAGAHRTLANNQFAFAFNQRGVANLDAGNVGDGVELVRRSIKWNTEIARATSFVFDGRSCGRSYASPARTLRLARIDNRRGEKNNRCEEEQRFSEHK